MDVLTTQAWGSSARLSGDCVAHAQAQATQPVHGGRVLGDHVVVVGGAVEAVPGDGARTRRSAALSSSREVTVTLSAV